MDGKINTKYVHKREDANAGRIGDADETLLAAAAAAAAAGKKT